MTPFKLMLNLTGLSQREASAFLEVALVSVEKMSRGIRSTPDGIMAELHGLHARQRKAARETIKLILEKQTEYAKADIIELGLASDDHEAQSPPLGWPCVGAQSGMMALVIAGCPDVKFRIVPRGTLLKKLLEAKS